MRDALAGPEVERFRAIVEERLGLVFDEHRRDDLASALSARLRERGMAAAEYLQGAAADRGELMAVAELLTVGETHFFRYPGQFAALEEQVLSYLAERRGNARLRILSAGCASGDEAYTVAMVAHRRHPALAARMEILGVDASAAQIARARTARYAAWSLRETPRSYVESFFRKERDEYLLDEQIRRGVEFQVRNLVEPNPDLFARGRFDVIFCRNVTIYFSPDVTQRLVQKFATALEPDGFLFLGHTETLRGVSHDFHLHQLGGAFYYQRRSGAPPPRPRPPERRPEPPLPQPDSGWADQIHASVGRVSSIWARRPDGRPTPPPAASASDLLELVRRERFGEAAAALEGLDAGARGQPQIQLLEAVVRANRGDLAGAERACRAVLEEDELDSGAHFVLGLCREATEDLPAARDEYRTAAYLDPEFGIALLRLGVVSRRLGEADEARRAVENARVLIRREDDARVLLFGGGFSREALLGLCGSELGTLGGAAR